MLIENITLLRERFPEVRKYFLEHEKEIQTDMLDIRQSKSGVLTAGYKLEGKELMVHSAYDPLREAERIIKRHEEQLKPNTHVMFFGIGLGYHIEAFKEQYPELTYSIFEPMPEMFLAMTSAFPLNKIFSKKLGNLYVDSVNKENFNYLQEFQVENRRIHIIVLPSYDNIAKDKKDTFLQNVKDAVQNRRSNLHTDAAFQKIWVLNSIKNFNEVLSTPNIIRDVDKEQFKDKPAIIVSAGPSLAEDIEHIRYIKENSLAYIFSVGSAINSLLSYDIMPDAVFTYDPGLKNHLVFEKMVEQSIDSIPMVFGSSVGFETLEQYKGPKVHFITTQDRTSLYFLKDQINLEQDLIIDSPSIAVMTFQILNKLGANPIIFAGQNLGYLYGRQYSKGIEYKHIDSKIKKEELKKAPSVLDVYGNEIKTNQVFNIMRNNIEDLAAFYKDKTFINTTKGGASIKGVPFKPIEDVITENLAEELKGNEWWIEDHHYEVNDITERYEELDRSKANLKLIIDKLQKTQKTLSFAAKANNKSEAETGLVLFDKLYNGMLDNTFYNGFLSFYLRVFLKYFANEIARLNQEKDMLEKVLQLEPLLFKLREQLNQGMQELDAIFKQTNMFR